MPFAIHAEQEVTPYESDNRRKSGSELTDIVKNDKSYLCNWTAVNVSVPPKQIQTYVGGNEKGEVTDHIVMARKKKNPCCSF